MILYKNVDGEEVAYLDEESIIAIVSYKLQRAYIPRDYINLSWADIVANLGPEIVHTCKNFKGVGLYIEGPNSQGKTTLACKLAETDIRRGKTAIFVLAGDLQNALLKEDGYGNNDDVLLQRAHAVDTLIIDDAWDPNKMLLWKSESSRLQIAAWDRFLRRRLGDRKRVIFTSNVPMAEVHKRYGISIGHLLYRNFLQIQVIAKNDLLKKMRRDMLQ